VSGKSGTFFSQVIPCARHRRSCFRKRRWRSQLAARRAPVDFDSGSVGSRRPGEGNSFGGSTAKQQDYPCRCPRCCNARSTGTTPTAEGTPPAVVPPGSGEGRVASGQSKKRMGTGTASCRASPHSFVVRAQVAQCNECVLPAEPVRILLDALTAIWPLKSIRARRNSEDSHFVQVVTVGTY
jgi:hypothetical protein